MRLGTIRHAGSHSRAVVQDGEHWVVLDAGDVGELVAQAGWEAAAAAALASPTSVRLPVAGASLLAPILRPEKILCCGLNYRDHIAETGRETPEFPTLFAKYADTLTAPDADISVSDSAKVDWEAELAVVVGKPIRGASREQAENAILGYTVANDVSMRDWQARTLQWLQGKAWDATTPIGPVIVTRDEISPTEGLQICADINGEVMQQSNTRELVFDAAELVSYVSQFTQLRPGDLILTGTPGGVGLGRSPARWLRDGEVLTTSIEGIGTLRNTLRITPPLEHAS